MEAPEVVPQDERVDLRSTLQDRGFNGALMSILSDPRSSSQGSSQGLDGGAKIVLDCFFSHLVEWLMGAPKIVSQDAHVELRNNFQDRGSTALGC